MLDQPQLRLRLCDLRLLRVRCIPHNTGPAAPTHVSVAIFFFSVTEDMILFSYCFLLCYVTVHGNVTPIICLKLVLVERRGDVEVNNQLHRQGVFIKLI